MGVLSRWEDLEWMRSPHCSNPKSLSLFLSFLEYPAKNGHELIITGIKIGKKKVYMLEVHMSIPSRTRILLALGKSFLSPDRR